MAKIMKYMLVSVVSLLVLIAVVLTAVVMLVDPNDYKAEITALVQDATGRELTLVGDIELSVFPWLGLSLGAAQLSNAEGFGDNPFAQVEGVEIGVKIMPLLQQRLEMKTVRLQGLQVELARHADGRSNWQDLSAGSETATAPSAEPGKPPAVPSLAALAIGGLEVVDARLLWDDRQTGQRLEVSNLRLNTGPVALNQPVDVSLAMDLSMAAPAVKSHLELSGQVALDLSGQRYRLDDLALSVQATGDDLPVSPLSVELSADVMTDLASDKLEVNALKLNVMGLTIQGRLAVATLQSEPQVQGKLTLANFSPRELMSMLGIAVPETADSNALTQAMLATEFNASANTLSINKLALVLDDSNLTGTASVSNFQQPAIEFDVILDGIDVDRYLPPAAQAAPPTPGAVAGAATQLPLDTLRALNVVGQLKAGKFKVAKARATNIVLGFKAQSGQLRIKPAQANLYQGSYQGNIGLDVRSDTPKLSLNEQLSNIAIGPLLKDVLGKDTVTGTGNVAAVLTANGVDPELMKKTLNGKANFAFRNGAVKGVNIGQMLREANAKLKNQPPPPKTSNQTDFAEMSGSVTIKNGVVNNDDLQVKSPLLRITGKGDVDLPRERINYRVSTSVVGSAEGQAGEDLAGLKSLTIPVNVSGTFTDPKFSLDLKPVLEAKAKAALEEKKKAIQQKATIKVEEKKEDVKKEIQNKLKSLFR